MSNQGPIVRPERNNDMNIEADEASAEMPNFSQVPDDECEGDLSCAMDGIDDTNPAAPESVPISASELLLAGLNEKKELLRIESERLRIEKAQTSALKLRCEALSSQLMASKKRQREASNDASALDAPTNPQKKPSPSPPRMATPRPMPTADPQSDDDVPAPIEEVLSAAVPEVREFDKLSSILCAYKDKKIVPGSIDFPFEVCADLCRDEAQMVLGWSPANKASLRPNVISALRLVYPDKREDWFSSHFLMSPSGAAKYWARVLARRAEIWDVASARLASRANKKAPNSVVERLRIKIAERKSKRLSNLITGGSSNNPYLTPARKAFCALTSSDSEDEGSNMVDLSQSPASASSAANTPASPASAATAVAKPKLAKGPESYSVAEMKTYVRMAKAIRNVSEKDGHTEATASFVDVEFSDNTGRVAKALKGRDTWKKQRVDAICAKAAKIMEDRLAHHAPPSPPP